MLLALTSGPETRPTSPVFSTCTEMMGYRDFSGSDQYWLLQSSRQVPGSAPNRNFLRGKICVSDFLRKPPSRITGCWLLRLYTVQSVTRSSTQLNTFWTIPPLSDLNIQEAGGENPIEFSAGSQESSELQTQSCWEPVWFSFSQGRDAW